MTQIAISRSTTTIVLTDNVSNLTTRSAFAANANSLYLANAISASSTPPGAPTMSGGGLTWVQVDTKTITSGSFGRQTVFRGQSAAPGAASVLTVAWGSGQSMGFLTVDEITNVDTSGTNGSGAVVQEVAATSTSTTIISVALAAFADATNNALWAASAMMNGSGAVTVGGQYTALGQVGNAGPPNLRTNTAWKIGGTPSLASQVFAATAQGSIIGIELKFNATGGGVVGQSTSLRNALRRRRRG